MQIRIVALWLFAQFFTACQQVPEQSQPLAEAIIGAPSSGACQQETAEKPLTSAANVIFQSTDGGLTWQDVSTGLPAGIETGGVFVGNGEVFIGTQAGMYRSSATGTPVWKQALFLDGRIVDVYTGQSGLYVCNYGVGLFQNIPGTDVWTAAGNLPERTVRTVMETRDGSLLVGTDKGVFKSGDGGQSWKQVFDGGMVLNLVSSGNILIAGGTQGVVRSTDGGEHWESAFYENIMSKNTGLLGDRFVTILGTKDPSKIMPEGITHRLRTSSDGGKTWQRLERALLPVQGIYEMDERLSQTRDIYDIVQVGKYLLCSFDTGIYRSVDQGKTWELVFTLDGKGSFHMAVSGQVIYAVPGGGC